MIVSKLLHQPLRNNVNKFTSSLKDNTALKFKDRVVEWVCIRDNQSRDSFKFSFHSLL